MDWGCKMEKNDMFEDQASEDETGPFSVEPSLEPDEGKPRRYYPAIETTPSASHIYGALARARLEFPPIPRTRLAVIKLTSGGQYSYKYADLADVIDATTSGLSAHGLAISQTPNRDFTAVLTYIYHESGGQILSRWPIKPMPKSNLDNAQSFQAAMQVAKRYALTAALGISTEETVEGDPKAIRNQQNRPKLDEDFGTEDGIRSPAGAVLKEGMTPREKAEEYARAIEAQFDEVKTIVGLNGVWNRNDIFIARFQDAYDDLFQSIYDKFHAMSDEYGGE